MVKKQPKKNNVKIRKNPNDQKKKFARKLTLFDSKFTREWKNDLGKATDGIMNVKEMKEIEKYLESKGKRGGGKMTMTELQAKLERAKAQAHDLIGEYETEKRMLPKMEEIRKRSLGKQQDKLRDLQKEIAKRGEKTQEEIIEKLGGKRKTKKRRRKKRRKRKSKRKRRK